MYWIDSSAPISSKALVPLDFNPDNAAYCLTFTVKYPTLANTFPRTLTLKVKLLDHEASCTIAHQIFPYMGLQQPGDLINIEVKNNQPFERAVSATIPFK